MYNTVHQIASDQDMRNRVAMAYADESDPGYHPDVSGSPYAWSNGNAAYWASAPGWAEAWESALANGVENPGADPGVITDAMILSQVQAMVTEPAKE